MEKIYRLISCNKKDYILRYHVSNDSRNWLPPLKLRFWFLRWDAIWMVLVLCGGHVETGSGCVGKLVRWIQMLLWEGSAFTRLKEYTKEWVTLMGTGCSKPKERCKSLFPLLACSLPTLFPCGRDSQGTNCLAVHASEESKRAGLDLRQQLNDSRRLPLWLHGIHTHLRIFKPSCNS